MGGDICFAAFLTILMKLVVKSPSHSGQGLRGIAFGQRCFVMETGSHIIPCRQQNLSDRLKRHSKQCCVAAALKRHPDPI